MVRTCPRNVPKEQRNLGGELEELLWLPPVRNCEGASTSLLWKNSGDYLTTRPPPHQLEGFPGIKQLPVGAGSLPLPQQLDLQFRCPKSYPSRWKKMWKFLRSQCRNLWTPNPCRPLPCLETSLPPQKEELNSQSLFPAHQWIWLRSSWCWTISMVPPQQPSMSISSRMDALEIYLEPFNGLEEVRRNLLAPTQHNQESSN